jgi:hypothetical protein
MLPRLQERPRFSHSTTRLASHARRGKAVTGAVDKRAPVAAAGVGGRGGWPAPAAAARPAPTERNQTCTCLCQGRSLRESGSAQARRRQHCQAEKGAVLPGQIVARRPAYVQGAQKREGERSRMGGCPLLGGERGRRPAPRLRRAACHWVAACSAQVRAGGAPPTTEGSACVTPGSRPVHITQTLKPIPSPQGRRRPSQACGYAGERVSRSAGRAAPAPRAAARRAQDAAPSAPGSCPGELLRSRRPPPSCRRPRAGRRHPGPVWGGRARGWGTGARRSAACLLGCLECAGGFAGQHPTALRFGLANDPPCGNWLARPSSLPACQRSRGSGCHAAAA